MVDIPSEGWITNDKKLIRIPPAARFQSFPYISVYIIFLAFVYVVTVVCNILLVYIIAVDRRLHTPKFLAVGNLAVIDIMLNTSTIPGMIKTFLFKDNFVPFNQCLLQMYFHYAFLALESYSLATIPSMIKIFLIKDNFIPFNLCLVQMFFYYVFGTLESYALAVLAYDRLIAICFPLRQNSVNTLRSMSCIVGLTWSFALGIIAFATGIITRLSFCNSLRVFSYFCDYAPVFRLACNDYTMQWSVASLLTFLLLIGPFTFILLSYVTILVTVFRMKSLDSRVKALATCVEHIILVAVFYIPLITIFMIGFYLRLIDPDQRVLSLSLASCLPPCINPIVYSLKTKDIKIRALALLRKK
ncbi:olfactory receptor 1496-like [Seriola lalandi dorsalis]|uniref:olfactory receptor 1496-like n=1 Tax=Seriola lalandi dorsalis TaxID=1841481 RepID=UPI000C6FB5BF|nr:olfactory receptor 1496-like [Seriola lalandi dorsalis]